MRVVQNCRIAVYWENMIGFLFKAIVVKDASKYYYKEIDLTQFHWKGALEGSIYPPTMMNFPNSTCL
jgi:hypothetical protein